MAKKKPRPKTKKQAETAGEAECWNRFEAFAADMRQAIDVYTIRLEKLIAERATPTTSDPFSWRSDPLLTLQQAHLRAIRNPEGVQLVDATTAINLAAEICIPSPPWAVKALNGVLTEKLGNKDVDLNKSFGFTAVGQGQTSEVEHRIQDNLADQSCVRIWGLVLLEYTLLDACKMEAGRLQRLPKRWNTTGYLFGHDLGSNKMDPDAREAELFEKRLKVAERLRQDYYARRSEIEEDSESAESRAYRAHLQKNRKAFLSEFD